MVVRTSAARREGSKRVRTVAVALAALVALAFATDAVAAAKARWYADDYNRIAQTISGVPDIQLLMEDDPAAWAYWADDPYGSALGFVCISISYPGHWCYHKIFVSPKVATALGLRGSTLTPVWDMVNSGATNPYDAAIAIMTVVHEAYHYRLFSRDEARVNACTARDLPHWLEREFRIPSTVQQTGTVPVVSTVDVQQPYRVRVWVKRNGKRVRVWVTRYRWVTVDKTDYVQQTVTVANPMFEQMVAAAVAFRAAQPPPYNAGTCS